MQKVCMASVFWEFTTMTSAEEYTLIHNKTATGWHLPANATYDTAANMFEQGFLRDTGTIALKNASVPIFCSDYALYWFDYRSGYDTVLAEVGWNNTLNQEIALVRGAANFQHKDWGVIITWKNTATAISRQW